MSFLDFPFMVHPQCPDERRYCGHRAVLQYLKHFADSFSLLKHIEFQTQVESVTLLSHSETQPKFLVQTKSRLGGESGSDLHDHEDKWLRRRSEYDAVIICNGHYFEPNFADFPGLEKWPGKQMHSHSYRTPEAFKGKVRKQTDVRINNLFINSGFKQLLPSLNPLCCQVVVVLGASASGEDISKELTDFASEVHLCSREGPPKEQQGKLHMAKRNMHLHQMVCFRIQKNFIR
jgi:cation diffusion facilitator CzcD-associated flavoprotein CzcO